MNYDKEWDNEASLEGIKEFKQYAIIIFCKGSFLLKCP
jgi:hypothetical protein